MWPTLQQNNIFKCFISIYLTSTVYFDADPNIHPNRLIRSFFNRFSIFLNMNFRGLYSFAYALSLLCGSVPEQNIFDKDGDLMTCYHFTIMYSLMIFPSIFSRSDPFRSFVDYCLLKIPQDRPSSGELLRVSGLPF